MRKTIRYIALGLLLGLILLEAALYCTAHLFLSSQEKLNLESLEKDGAYRILCFGDSTTAIGGKDSWPSQLEDVLNEREFGKTFSVINKGVVLIDTRGVLLLLEESLDAYHPDMVIVMAGMNDAKKEPSRLYGLKSFLHRFRTYRLAEQFWPGTFNAQPIDYDNTAKAYAAPETISNFNAIHDVLEQREIPLVVMQYPLRALAPLKGLFGAEDGIIFVDNENLFKDVLDDGEYEEYFVDRFAGDFGHCTKKGNRLIADTVADIILKYG